jgi:hypothetical protein
MKCQFISIRANLPNLYIQISYVLLLYSFGKHVEKKTNIEHKAKF